MGERGLENARYMRSVCSRALYCSRSPRSVPGNKLLLQTVCLRHRRERNGSMVRQLQAHQTESKDLRFGLIEISDIFSDEECMSDRIWMLEPLEALGTYVQPPPLLYPGDAIIFGSFLRTRGSSHEPIYETSAFGGCMTRLLMHRGQRGQRSVL